MDSGAARHRRRRPRRSPPQNGKLRQNEIDDLRGLDRERGLAEEIAKRIGRLEIGHLQNALVDREDDDARRPIGLVADLERLARFREIARAQSRPAAGASPCSP